MSITNPGCPSFPTEIKDYLSKGSKFRKGFPNMPDWEDRDLLNKRQQQIWDFFFQIDPDDLINPHLNEIASLNQTLEAQKLSASKEQMQIQAKIDDYVFKMSTIPTESDEKKQKVEDAILLRQKRKKASRKVTSIALLIIGIILTIAGLALFFLGSNVNGNSETGSFKGFIGTTQMLLAACCFMPGLFLTVLGWFINKNIEAVNNSKDEKATAFEKVDLAAKLQQQELQHQIEELQSKIANSKKQLSYFADGINACKDSLNSEIKQLRKKIPQRPTVNHIDSLLQEDMERLANKAITRLSLQGRLGEDQIKHTVQSDSLKNTYLIRTPAELQSEKDLNHDNLAIWPSYLKEGSNAYKHFIARETEEKINGKFADFYGVYRIEFLILAEHLLATYSAFFDFITQELVGDRVVIQAYKDVVTTNSSREYRVVKINGEEVGVKNMPSIHISLTNALTVDITFPAEDYFKKISSRTFNESDWHFNPAEVGEAGRKAIQERVNAAKFG